MKKRLWSAALSCRDRIVHSNILALPGAVVTLVLLSLPLGWRNADTRAVGEQRQQEAKAEARARLRKAYDDQAVIEQEIVMLRSFLGRHAADIKPKKMEL
jgi:hypothetical protein